MKSNFPLSQKYIDFINTTNGVDVEFLEGTTASGKTTVGAGVKFMRMVSRSEKKLHILAAKTVGIAEKNIINQDNGILDLHRNATYYGNGTGEYRLPHIKFEDKVIFVIPYGDKSKWALVLGGQYGCVYIDEINTADIEFVREISTRNEYMLATLNPDDPDLPVYSEFINRSRPFKKYEEDVPPEIMRDLLGCEATPKWRYWFFTFRDNLALTEAEIEKKRAAAPKGTKLYKNKIEGLRCKAVGLVFGNFEYSRNIRTAAWVREQLEKYKRYDPGKDKPEDKGFYFKVFTCGVDTSYSSESEDTISFMFQGITNTGYLITLDEFCYNNKNHKVPLAPSDTCQKLVEFLEKNRHEWGLSRFEFIDSADQATLTELAKYKARTGTIYTFGNAYKKTKIIDRVILQRGWIQDGFYIVLPHCTEHLAELGKYSYDEGKNVPEDRNDHTINAGQYAWLPYTKHIGSRNTTK